MPAKETDKPKLTLKETYPYILVIGGFLGLLSAIILTVEKVHLLKNPDAVLSCDLNPIVACGSVINTAQASAFFGVPNPLWGISAFSVVITIGMALLAGAKFKKWFWIGLQTGTFLGVVFFSWLAFQSIYSIGALCPYCMVVWAVTMPIFLYTLLYNLRYKNFKTPKKLKKANDFAQAHHAEVLLVWYLLILLVILNHFWYYWSSLI